MKRLLFFSFIFQIIITAQNISALLPDSVEGWRISNVPEVYIGEDLFRLIDGGADIFHEYGFKQVVTQRYTNVNDKIISVEVYEMIDSSAAFGIFSLFTFRTGKPVNFSSAASEGDEFLIFWKGNYYIALSGYESSEEIKNGFFLIAKNIDGKIKPSGKPLLVNLFEQIKDSKPEAYQPMAEKIAYLKGNLGLYNLSDIEVGRNLKIEEGVCLETDSAVSFIFKYKTEEESKDKFLSLIEKLKNNPMYSLINSEDSPQSYSEETGFLFKNHGNKYNYMVQFRDHIIISSAVEAALITPLVEEIKTLLK